jgi:murein DD-endopeptidase MepM/ murein hydrolase activator NlpD
MIDKRFSIYCTVLSCLASIMTILIVLLFFEYRFFCKQAHELILLKNQYHEYVTVLQKKIGGDTTVDEVSVDEVGIPSFDVPDELVNESPATMAELSAAEASDDPDDDDEYVDESFVVINRQPEYLKQSTLDYIQSQDLHPLMTTIDMDRWSDYTDQVVPVVQEKKQSIVKSVVREKPQAKISAIRRPLKNFGFMWPIDADKFWLSSLFGPRKRINGTWGFHHGIDMAAIKGTAVKAACAGTIVEASFQTGYGNTVVIKHNETIKTRYAHLHTIRVYVGQKIKQGAVVGTVGETGFIRKKGKDGSHLHFEVYEWGKRINPLHCLPRTA